LIVYVHRRDVEQNSPFEPLHVPIHLQDITGSPSQEISRHVTENTVEAFDAALQHGCDGFEFDVRRSADGQAVICHDAVTRGMVIAKTTASALALPTLGDVLSSFGRRAFLDIELKVAGLEQQTVGLLRKHLCKGACGLAVAGYTECNGADSTIPEFHPTGMMSLSAGQSCRLRG
jgi:glycerophosphoryl diester phosphodiesterase